MSQKTVLHDILERLHQNGPVINDFDKTLSHLPTDCGCKVWHESRTTCAVSIETAAPLQESVHVQQWTSCVREHLVLCHQCFLMQELQCWMCTLSCNGAAVSHRNYGHLIVWILTSWINPTRFQAACRSTCARRQLRLGSTEAVTDERSGLTLNRPLLRSDGPLEEKTQACVTAKRHHFDTCCHLRCCTPLF